MVRKLICTYLIFIKLNSQTEDILEFQEPDISIDCNNIKIFSKKNFLYKFNFQIKSLKYNTDNYTLNNIYGLLFIEDNDLNIFNNQIQIQYNKFNKAINCLILKSVIKTEYLVINIPTANLIIHDYNNIKNNNNINLYIGKDYSITYKNIQFISEETLNFFNNNIKLNFIKIIDSNKKIEGTINKFELNINPNSLSTNNIYFKYKKDENNEFIFNIKNLKAYNFIKKINLYNIQCLQNYKKKSTIKEANIMIKEKQIKFIEININFLNFNIQAKQGILKENMKLILEDVLIYNKNQLILKTKYLKYNINNKKLKLIKSTNII